MHRKRLLRNPGIFTQLSIALFMTSSCIGQDCVSSRHPNCIDSCILEFARLSDKPITPTQLVATIQMLGLPTVSGFRSLADGKSILDALAIPVEAIHLQLAAESDFPDKAMVYLHNKFHKESVGHVIVVAPVSKNALRIYDPDGNPIVRQANALQFMESAYTVALVPKDYAEHAIMHAFLTNIVTFLIGGILLAGAVRLLSNGRRRAILPSVRPAALSILAFIALSFASCSLPDTPQTRELEHDFGLLNAAAGTGDVSHTFYIANTSSKPIHVSNVVLSCGCISLARHIVGTVIPSNESLVVPVTISTDSRVGPVVQQVVVYFAEEDQQPIVLRLRGFVQKLPHASSEPVLLDVPRNDRGIAYAEISYVRKAGSQPAALDSYHIAHCRETYSSTKGVELFEVGRPSHEQRAVNPDSIAEIWKFPIVFEGRDGPVRSKAELLVKWKYPKATLAVQVIANPLPFLKTHSKIVYFLPCKEEMTHTESIPVWIYDMISAQKCEVTSGSDYICARLNTQKSRLDIELTPLTRGDYEHTVTISCEGYEDVVLIIRGTVL